MKGLFGSGPRRQRAAMRFGYDVRPSFWHELKANSHLVIAACGTVALLGIAGTALWLAMPPGERPAFAEAKPHAQPAAAPAQAVPAAPVALAGSGVESSRVAPKADAVRPRPVAEADLPALKGTDPRWTPADEAAAAAGNGDAPAGGAERAAEDEAAPAPEAVAAADGDQDGDAAAFADDTAPDAAAHAGPDPKAATAAIPAPRPEASAKKAAAGGGTILRAVTMRAAPKKGGAAIGTVPAKAAVEVVSCASWCEIVYQGKRGFIYKSFLQRGG